MDQAFRDAMTSGYTLTEPSLIIGSAMLDGELFNDTRVQIALSMLNRHGLIAGATGTGKTKTLQLLAGQASKAGIPVFVADIKGDLTGLAGPGDGTNPKVVERATSMAWTFEAAGHPVEFVSLSGKLGSQVRATVHSFGPLLLGKVLDLNDTQTSILALIFKYCDDNDLPLLDLKDLTAVLKLLSSDEGKPILADYGGMSPASVGVLLRSIVVLEQEGADVFFGEPEFEVEDLLRTTPEGLGIITVLELSDVMDKPRLFSTFMLWMLAQLYESLPEAEALFLLRRGVPVVRRRQQGAPGPGRADRPADPLEGRRGVLRDAGADRRPVADPRAAREPLPARAAGVHPRGRRRAAKDRPDLPDHHVLRRREDHHVARHRRSAHHAAVA